MISSISDSKRPNCKAPIKKVYKTYLQQYPQKTHNKHDTDILLIDNKCPTAIHYLKYDKSDINN